MTEKNETSGRKSKILLRLAVTFILVGVILWKLGGPGEVVDVMLGVDPLYVALILIVNTFDRALMTFKWLWLLRSRGVELSLIHGMRIYCAAMIWGLFLPSTVGADAIRAFSTARAGHDSDEVVASIVVERMIGFLSALLFGLFSLLLLSQLGVFDARFRYVWWPAAAMLAGATFVFVASLSQRTFDLIYGRLLGRFQGNRIVRRLRNLHQVYRSYQGRKRTLLWFFALTLAEQLMPILHSWLIAQGLGIQVDMLYIVGAVPLAILIARIPVSIDGLGVFDGVFIVVLSLAGVSASEAVAITLFGRIIQTVSWAPWWMAHIINIGSPRPPQAWVEAESS